jgi:hypothetical protein
MRPTDCVVRRAQIGEPVGCLRLHFSAPLPVVDRERTKFQPPRFFGMQLRVELPHYSGGKFRPKLAGIHFVVEFNHDIIGESHEDNVVVRSLPTPGEATSRTHNEDRRLPKAAMHFRPERALLTRIRFPSSSTVGPLCSLIHFRATFRSLHLAV